MATVEELIVSAQTNINATLATASGFLSALVSVANAAASTGESVAGTLPASYNYQSVPIVDMPLPPSGGPNVVNFPLGSPPTAPTVNFFVPTEIILPVDDLLAPTHEFEFFEAAYQSALLDPLKAKLLADLANGGFGIDTADEQALFQRARDRETESAMSRIDEAGRAMAARGFPLPPGELSIQIDRSYQDLQNKMSSVSREIFVDSAKRFVENRQFTIEQVRQLETVLLGFHNSIQERAFNVAKATTELGITLYNALILRYRTRVEAAKLTADVQLTRAQIDIARAGAEVEIFKGQIAAYEVNLRRLVEQGRYGAELDRVRNEVFRISTEGVIARANLQQKVLEATSQQNIQIGGLHVETAKARLQALLGGLQFSQEATKFGSQEFFSLITAMVGSLNTLAVQSAEEEAA
jgi:hypothetical protein